MAILALPVQAADLYGYGTGNGYAGVPYQRGFHTLPVCDEPGVVSKVVGKFASTTLT